MFEVSTASSNTSLQLLCEVFHSFVDRSLWQVAPDNLNCLLEFGDCLRLYFKLAVSLQHCTPHIGFIFGEFGGHWSLVMKSEQLARSQFCVLHDVARCASLHAVCADGTGPLFRRSAIPKVHCADTHLSANVWVKVRLELGLGFGSALGLGLELVGIVDFRNSGPSE